MATYLRQTAGALPNRLVIQLGDMIPEGGKPGEIGLDFYRFAMPYMGYDLAGIGDLEIRAYKLIGEQSIADLGVPVVCANVIREKDSKPLVGKPYIVKKMPSGLRVAVIGVVGDAVVFPEMQKDFGIRILPPADVLKANMEKLRKDADVVVVLAHVTYEGALTLASQVTGIDVILSSHPSGAQKDYEKVGNTIVMQCRKDCQYVGKLTLDIDADGKITSSASEQVPLNDKLADDIEIAKMIEAGDKRRRDYYTRDAVVQTARLNGAQTEPPVFAGADQCAKCHGDINKSWKKTKHVRAYDSLKSKKDPYAIRNPNCLSCHTTGFDMDSGFTTEKATKHLKSVQCESCHGAGSVHIQKPKEPGYGKTSNATCLQCHDRGNSPDFNYEKFLAEVRH